MSDEMAILRARVDRAERWMRLSACACVGALVLLGVGGLGAHRAADELGGVVFEDGIVTAKGVIVVDDERTPRIQMGADPEAQRQVELFGIVIRDSAGAERFGVGVNELDWVVLGMDAPLGVGSPMRDRIALIVGSDGSASVRLIDNETTVPIEMFSHKEGGGGLRLGNYDDHAKTVSTRAITFEGEGAASIRQVGGD